MTRRNARSTMFGPAETGAPEFTAHQLGAAGSEGMEPTTTRADWESSAALRADAAQAMAAGLAVGSSEVQRPSAVQVSSTRSYIGGARDRVVHAPRANSVTGVTALSLLALGGALMMTPAVAAQAPAPGATSPSGAAVAPSAASAAGTGTASTGAATGANSAAGTAGRAALSAASGAAQPGAIASGAASPSGAALPPAAVSVALAATFEEPPGPPEPVVRSNASLLAVALSRPARFDKQPVAPGSIEAMSMFAVRSPEQRKFARHDLVQIVVREASRAKSGQTLDTKKNYSVAAEVAWGNFSFDAFGQPGVATQSGQHNAPVFEAIGRKRLKGEGDYDRSDEFVTRMTAEVIEVLPNGNLILEARTTIQNDKEVSSIKLTGRCRPEDITSGNTVLSNQIHDLKIEKMNTGFVKDAADKGIIAQILDAVLAF
ncbi:MAG: flagellar basal body L-ring protein FlgH [Phycisphaeraceae bacterium]|nr:flagellar basal body L-ring protein FlgH [Phycisphaeraceae bacterium]